MIFAAIVMMAGFSTNVMAQTSATTTTATSAGAVLIVPMTLAQTSPLHFGTIALIGAGVTGGTVTLPSNSINRAFSGVSAANALVASNPATNAAYNVTGTRDETYALTLPATTTVTAALVGLGSGATTMNITLMTARFNGAAVDGVTSTLSATGTDSFTLGGTLTIAAGQEGGIYTGSFNASVDYN